MKIKKVVFNNKKRCFEVFTRKGWLIFPYSKLRLKPFPTNPIARAYVDAECAREAFTYHLASGAEDTVPLDAVLEYNRDPDYLRDMLLYRLSLQARELLGKSKIKRREVIRRMQTSPTQFYRLIDQSNYHKTIDQMIKLLAALDCPVDIVPKKVA